MDRERLKWIYNGSKYPSAAPHRDNEVRELLGYIRELTSKLEKVCNRCKERIENEEQFINVQDLLEELHTGTDQ